MISILPMQNREEEKKLLSTVHKTGENDRILQMKDGEDLMGWVAVELCENILRIHHFCVPEWQEAIKPNMEQTFLLDTLLRSASSYGENNGADEIVTSFPDFFDFLKRRGFLQEEGYAHTPMSTIVHYS